MRQFFGSDIKRIREVSSSQINAFICIGLFYFNDRLLRQPDTGEAVLRRGVV